MNAADTLTKLLMAELQRKYPLAMIWRNNTGAGVGWSVVQEAVTCLRHGDIGKAITLLARPLRWGMVGSADILMVIGPHSKFGGIEVKAGADRQSKEQEAWAVRVRHLGGFYVIARDVESCMNDLEKEICPKNP